tara:strand:- start:816 stop:1547 length:732 start_codon:yes stop_codon:yes gene_type:complete
MLMLTMHFGPSYTFHPQGIFTLDDRKVEGDFRWEFNQDYCDLSFGQRERIRLFFYEELREWLNDTSADLHIEGECFSFYEQPTYDVRDGPEATCYFSDIKLSCKQADNIQVSVECAYRLSHSRALHGWCCPEVDNIFSLHVLLTLSNDDVLGIMQFFNQLILAEDFSGFRQRQSLSMVSEKKARDIEAKLAQSQPSISYAIKMPCRSFFFKYKTLILKYVESWNNMGWCLIVFMLFYTLWVIW